MEHKCNKIAFVNGKGGCGKTTSLFNVAGVLSSRGYKVLIVDLDKQRNATEIFLMNVEMPEKTIYDFFEGNATLYETTAEAYCLLPRKRKEQYYNVDCVCSDVRIENESFLREVDIDYVRNSFESFVDEKGYDWVLVDMPPSNKAINDICFSVFVDYCIIPFTSDILSVTGYGDLVEELNRARTINSSLNILGVFLSRYSANSSIDQYILSQVKEFGRAYIPVQIPMSTDLRETIIFGRPISYYKNSKSKIAFEQLVDEMVHRIDNKDM